MIHGLFTFLSRLGAGGLLLLQPRAWRFTPVLWMLLFAVFGIWSQALYAKQNFLPQLKFSHIAANQLERLGHINDITQDAEGYLWFAAAKGLARYNGYELTTFRHKSGEPGLPTNWVSQLLVSRDGVLWVVTREGICRYDAKQLKFACNQLSEAHQPKPSYDLLFEDSQGLLWLASDAGLFHVNQQNLALSPNASTWLQQHTVGENNSIKTMLEDADGYLWLGHNAAGLSRYNPATGQAQHWEKGEKGLQSNDIRALMLDNTGRLWVGTQGAGVMLFDLTQEQFTRYWHDTSEKSDTVWDILQDQRGLIWIGDGTGVHVVNPADMSVENHHFVEGKTHTPGNFVVRSLFEDRTGGLWLGYFPSGIDRVDEQASQFVSYRYAPDDEHSLPDGGVLATLEAPDGKLWVGAGFGLGLLDRQSQTFTRYVHSASDHTQLSGSTILDMAYGPNGDLWLGAWDRGLNRRDPVTGAFKHYLPQPDNPYSILGREPWSLLLDSDKRLWIATEKGLNRYRPASDDFEHYLPKDAQGQPIASWYTRGLYEDKRGALWIASFSGLWQLDRDTGALTAYMHDPQNRHSISSDMVLCLFEDSQQRLWVGTDGAGLNLLDRESGRFERFGEESGLPDLSVTSIVEDKQGQLWLSTYQGLAVFDPKLGVTKHYTRGNGLPGNLFNRHTGTLLSSGELAFGSTEGLVIFSPQQLASLTPVAPQLVLNELRIFNQTVHINDATGVLSADINHANHIRLNHKQSAFSVGFAALDYRAPENNRYAYRLLGYEEAWNFVDAQHFASYTNLDAGDYTLEVKAANSSGIWSEVPKKLSIEVAPPFWLTWWAKAIYAMVLLGGLVRIHIVQRNGLLHARKKLRQERELIQKMLEVDRLKDNITLELDRKVEQRTAELEQEKERLLTAHTQLAELNEKLESMSVTDQLTQLHNRHYLDQFIQEDLALVARQIHSHSESAGLVFVIMDMDNFKQVNDSYGHNAGDAVLVQLADILRRVVRQSDYLVRWGGEEFVIVMRQLKLVDVEPFVERLRESVASHMFNIGTEQPLHKTVSIGFAAYPFCRRYSAALNWAQITAIADLALYCAKASGKNAWVGLHCDDALASPESLGALAHKEQLLAQLQNGQLKARSNLPATQLIWR